MSRILFVSIAFPPKNDPECLQAARYFKYLSKDPELALDVVTSRIPTLFMPCDPGLEKYNNGYGQIIELPIRESRVSNFALRKIGLGKTLFPDSKMSFHKQSAKVIRQLKSIPDVIYSRSNPMSSAFMAMKLKAYYRKPWVMHMSDPWAISPLKNLKPDHPWLAKEMELLQSADAVTFTSPKTLQHYKNLYKDLEKKFTVLPNVFDPDDLREIKEGNGTKFTIVYTGGLTGNRNAFFLLDVLHKLNTDYPGLMDKIEFIFAGDADRANRDFFKHCPPAIRHDGILTYDESRDLCESANLLLVIDNPVPENQSVFFPSKLLDYFLARKMVWAVTPEGSTTREILKAYPGRAHEHNKVGEMAAFLSEMVKLWEARGNEPFRVNEIPSGYDARVNAAILKELLISVQGS